MNDKENESIIRFRKVTSNKQPLSDLPLNVQLTSPNRKRKFSHTPFDVN